MLNRIVLIGRLTRDPEVSTGQSGVSMAKFSIAVDRPTKNRDTGEKETDFIDIVAFRQTADFVGQYLGKGRLVGVDGRLQIRRWTAQDGTQRRNAEVVADSVQGLDRAAQGDGQAGQPAGSGPSQFTANQQAYEADPFAEDS